MSKRHFARIFGAAIVFAVAISVALPAQAFYLEMPRIFQKVKAQQDLYSGQALSPGGPGEQGTGGQGGSTPPGTGQQQPQQQPQQQLQQNQNNQPWADMCSNNTELACVDGSGNFVASAKVGSDGKPVCPANSSAQCGNYSQQNKQQGPNNQGQGQQFGPGNQMQGGQQGQNPEDQARQLKDMQRGAKQMKVQLNKLTLVFQSAEKKGTIIPDEIKQKLEQAKQMIAAIDAASGTEGLQDIDMGELGSLVQELEQARRDVIEAAQRLQDIKRGMQGMEKGLVMFEKQIAKLTKQNIAIPAEVTENINKIKSIIAAVKQAKTWDEAMDAGIEDMQDLMQNLDQYRQQLEMLARWPQTIKQLAKDVKQMDSALKRDKLIVDKLSKKGIDLNNVYSQFEEAVNKIKAARDEATNKMNSGDAEEAFNMLQDDVFTQMDDVWQHDRVIQMMSNLGRFTSDFKRGIAQAQATIKKLQKKKLDTSMLQDLLSQSQSKGQEILDMMKSSEIDEDLISTALEEIQNLQQEFQDEVSNLTGEEQAMPWDTGKQQFNQISVPSSISNMMPQKSAQPQGSPAPLAP
ncbi:MAG: hypothetical protein V1661_01200 [bacterium]